MNRYSLISAIWSDGRCGGPEQALSLAIEYRNRVERELGRPRSDELIIGINRLNTSGYIGVRRDKRRNRFIIGLGREPRRTVRIDERGELSAFRRAIAIRRELEIKRYGSPLLVNAERILSRVFEQ